MVLPLNTVHSMYLYQYCKRPHRIKTVRCNSNVFHGQVKSERNEDCIEIVKKMIEPAIRWLIRLVSRRNTKPCRLAGH